MPVSRLDVVYRKLLLSKFFVKGWGVPQTIKRLFKFRKIMSNRATCYQLVPKNYPITILSSQDRANYRIIEGKFKSPLGSHLPGVVPSEVEDAYFQMILPVEWPSSNFKPICIHLAGTGDHYYWRRRNVMAKPLLKDGIGAIILENPYYGLRKPKDQIRSSVHYVSDIFVMGGCLMLECIVLLNWCEELGLGPLGVTGISMGGHGVMSESINWDFLQEQYLSNKLYCEELSKLCKIVDDPFACNLSRNLTDYADYSYDISDLVDELKSSYMTPYELVNLITSNPTNCHAMNYKSFSHEKNFSTQLNRFKKIPFLTPSDKVIKMRKRAKEALWFMRGMMDECTHLRNFSVPVDTSLIISICAKADGYVPRAGVSKLDQIWPGATVRYVECGHVGAYLWHLSIFRAAIIEGFNKAKEKKTTPTSKLPYVNF
ncbi:protein ABHD18 isoform X2 [Cylas formicarius]|uniref:protein ABHD18 isoform X2 n=1 Tax=Cylas formicarius TaxID=197179 RepID=UPI0029583D39|nr:protein ABHD18 isoform X2 [Cylas formicarius]